MKKVTTIAISLSVIFAACFWMIKANIGGLRAKETLASKISRQAKFSGSLVSDSFVEFSQNQGFQVLEGKVFSELTNANSLQKTCFVHCISNVIRVYSSGTFNDYFTFKNSFGNAVLQIAKNGKLEPASPEELKDLWNSKSLAFLNLAKKAGVALPEPFSIKITKYNPDSLIIRSRKTVVASSGLESIISDKQVNGFGKIENTYFDYERKPENILDENKELFWINAALTCYTDLGKVPGYVAFSFYWDPAGEKWIPHEMISCSPPSLFLMF